MSEGFSEGLSEGLSEGFSEGMSEGYAEGPGEPVRQGPGRARPFGGGDIPGGTGFPGGYGDIARSGFATPLDLAYKPWAADFFINDGKRAFPTDDRLNPWAFSPHLEWRTEDWDPAIRYWSLEFDLRLTEWLQTTNLAGPNVMAAREFALQHKQWQYDEGGPDNEDRLLKQIDALIDNKWLAKEHVAWWGWKDPKDRSPRRDCKAGWIAINQDLESLVADMNDSRVVYLNEARAQDPEMRQYFTQLLGIDPVLKPWTGHLMRCATAVAHIAYMYFKGRFKRVRPSKLCPGLAVPFGPPEHPAFPSGHSTAAHLVALCLLEVPAIAELYGVVDKDPNGPRKPPKADDLRSNCPPQCPLLWLADRIARNRERLGFHYPSDSQAGRYIAIKIWESVFHSETIAVPTLKRALYRAEAEWRRA
jgi:hypothetical protein